MNRWIHGVIWISWPLLNWTKCTSDGRTREQHSESSTVPSTDQPWPCHEHPPPLSALSFSPTSSYTVRSWDRWHTWLFRRILYAADSSKWWTTSAPVACVFPACAFPFLDHHPQLRSILQGASVQEGAVWIQGYKSSYVLCTCRHIIIITWFRVKAKH